LQDGLSRSAASRRSAQKKTLPVPFWLVLVFFFPALLPGFCPALAEQDCKGKNFYFPGNILWKII
jgi:hypothetical protein